MRPTTARALRSTLAGASLLLALRAAPAAAQTCSTGAAARGAVASSYFDTLLNGSDKEDAQFFTKSGGIPNIFFLLDNSASMVRLPPNGGGFYPETYPPLADPSCPTGGDSKDPDCKYKALNAFDADCNDMANCPVIGCGDDAVSAGYAGARTLIGWFRARQFFPPCGTTLTDGLFGTRYGYDAAGTFVGGDVIDYAAQSSKCPYYAQGANAIHIPDADGKAGFDPDFYCGSGGTAPNLTCSGQKPNFFDKSPVFHDAVVNIETGSPGDGWTHAAVFPAKKGNTVLSVDDFCADLYTAGVQQGTVKKREICSSCLKKRGFFFDGRLFRASTAMDGLSNVGYPSLWLAGNWLNFYPPKFVIARKVLKDVVMDKVKVRMGIAAFGATGADHSQYQPLKPTCDMPDANWTSARSTFINQVNDFAFDKGTPMARALLDIGQYYHTPSLDWFAIDDTWNTLSNTTQQSVCYSCQASTIILISDGVPKSTDGNDLPAGTVTSAEASSRYAGLASTTHGITPTIDAAKNRTGGIPTSLCSACEAFSVDEDWKNNPIRVAWYLHNLDLRENEEATADCRTMNGKQTLDTYAVGFATSALSDADKLLRNVAAMGGGDYVSAENPAALRQGLDQILTTINERTTSFSVATVSTLQTTSGHSVIVPRFDPAKENQRLWRGHLFRYELYSEFLNPCEESADGTGVGDLDCDGKCLSVFLQDAEGAFIQEDDSGIFRKNQNEDAAPCSQASACTGKAGKACSVAGTPEATPHWDTQAAMKAQTWRTGRRVYSVVDDSGPDNTPDGKIDRYDTVFRLVADTTVATKLAPYLRLGGAGGGNVCAAIANTIATRGDPDTATRVRNERTFCAKEIVRFIMGADVFNDNGAKPDSGVWPMAATDTGQNALPDREIQLGDVFHSAPVVVDPPLPADGVLCPNGLHSQCLPSLWKTPTAGLPANTNPYDAYAKSAAYRNRRKIIVVGANDGLLRAIDGGTWIANPDPGHGHNDVGDDPLTEGLDESLPPFNGYYTRGTGQEVWAFLPPDMISKIPMLATGHQLFVDGSPMIRDVWVDGTMNNAAVSASVALDGKKQAHEFHTVAVVGERRGGTHYFALDLTDATKLPTEAGAAAPEFLWLYPQTNDAETLTFGETYNDYLPSRPPIGPVRIKSDTTSDALFGTSVASGSMAVAGVTGAVPYHERWVTFLAGGFDPQGIRGRGVHMVDVWTGHELFDFSRPTTGCGAEDTDPRCQLNAPIAATVAMIMWGSAASANSSFGNDFFFDTATFGDTAGQLWTIRFSDPGVLDDDPSKPKRVTNWYGGRSFQVIGCANQPFFHITANAQVPGGWLRTYAGTGDRYNLLDTFGGQCGPDNLRACAARGCTVTVTSTDDANSLACTGLGRETGSLALSSCDSSNAFFSSTSRAYASTLSGCVLEGKAKIAISCSATQSTTKDVRVSCTDSADGLTCGYAANAGGTVLDLGDATDPIAVDNWYFSIRVFDTANRPIFRDSTQAAAYDSNRLTVTNATTASTGIVLIDGSVDAPTALADKNSPGWAMFFNHDGTRTVDDHAFSVSRYDERVSSTSALYGMLSWNTIQPVSGGVERSASNKSSCQVARCTVENRRLAYHYVADPVTGGSMMRDASGALVRSIASTALVPSMGDQPTVFVNQQGQVQVALTAVNPEKGAGNITTGVMRDPTPSFGVIPVSRDTHDCRHATSAPDEALCK
jgi:type IV pilus assembly protein PilY1